MSPSRRSFAMIVPMAFLAAFAMEGPARAGAPVGFTNGSFESGGAGPFMASMPGWGPWLGPASSGSDFGVALTSTPPEVAESGSYYAFFHASQDVTDCLGQQLNTVVGQQYSVSFWMATDGPTNAQSSLFQVVWGPDFGPSSNDAIVNYQSTSSSPQAYKNITLTFTAVTTQDILSFHGYDATSNILLDNITVVPLGESVPATTPWLLLLLATMMSGVAVYVLRRTPGGCMLHV